MQSISTCHGWVPVDFLIGSPPFKTRKKLHSCPFISCFFWIRAFNLPVDYCKEAVAIFLMNFMGKFVACDSAVVTRRWQSYLRFRVEIDIRQPLKWLKKVAIRDGTKLQVIFKYEKLPPFCYLCSKLGHTE